MSQDKMREALKKALTHVPHDVTCGRINPRDEWQASGIMDFSECTCLRKQLTDALSEPPEPADRERIIEECVAVVSNRRAKTCTCDTCGMLEILERELRALKTIPSQTTQREPVVMVPREPTEAILAAMKRAWCEHNHGYPYDKELPDLYRAMLAAAHPEPQQPREGE